MGSLRPGWHETLSQNSWVRSASSYARMSWSWGILLTEVDRHLGVHAFLVPLLLRLSLTGNFHGALAFWKCWKQAGWALREPEHTPHWDSKAAPGAAPHSLIGCQATEQRWGWAGISNWQASEREPQREAYSSGEDHRGQVGGTLRRDGGFVLHMEEAQCGGEDTFGS